MKFISSIFLLAAAFLPMSLVVPRADAQAYPTATRTPIQVGAAFSFAAPDYGAQVTYGTSTTPYIQGFTAFGDIGLTRRIGAEAEFHDLSVVTPLDFGENSFLLGPRYSFALEDRANLYLKALGGIGRFNYQSPTYLPHSDSYGIVALGGGIEYHASNRINIRALDAEYQLWPGFQAHSLHPFVISIGAAYLF
jgi:hypothetical protein